MPIPIVCAQCERTYSVPPSRADNSRFCSKQCRDISQRGSGNPCYRGIEFACDHCGQLGTQPPSQYARNKHHFCSAACKGSWQSARAVREHNYFYRGGGIERECEACGTTFVTNRYHAENGARFCTHECYGGWRVGRFAGPDHPQWNGGGIKYYGPNWQRQRRRARTRDGHTCQECGAQESDLGQELDVHHVQPFRTFDYVPGENESYRDANRLENLICYCHPCHMIIERALERSSGTIAD